MELTEKQQDLVRNQIPAIGLVTAYYGRFGEEALEVSRIFALQLGKGMGERIRSAMQVTGTDAVAVGDVLNTFLLRASGAPIGTPDLVVVEGDKVIAVNEGFCAIMEAARAIGAPHEKICRNYSWPIFEGIASAVNPGVKQEVRESRALGDSRCRHVIVVPIH